MTEKKEYYYKDKVGSKQNTVFIQHTAFTSRPKLSMERAM